MGFYGRQIFPRLMDRLLRTPRQMEHRRRALAPARGQVLELGFGTALNLAAYPPGVRRVVGVDIETMLPRRTRRRARMSPVAVHRIRADAARLPLRDATFDTAVSTWTLCSLADPGAALGEVRRVLRPGGRFVFLEHGRSPRPFTARLQRWLNPLQRRVGRGCHLDRAHDRLLRAAGFRLERLDRFDQRGLPSTFTHMYRGVARPAPPDGA